MKLKTIILEDSLFERDTLIDLCKSEPLIDLVNAFTNTAEANNYLQTFSVDLIITDIMMEGGTGIDFIKGLTNQPLIVITSSHTEYAIEAYELNVIDFIAKPITEERFGKTIQKIKEYSNIKNSIKLEEQNEISLENKDYFYIKDSSEFIKVHYNDILYMESLGNFTKIHVQTGKNPVCLVGLKQLETELPTDKFARIHRSFIVNIDQITSIFGDEIKIGEITLPIGKTYKELFIKDHVVQKLISNPKI